MRTPSETGVHGKPPGRRDAKDAGMADSDTLASWVKLVSIGVILIALMVIIRALPVQLGIQIALAWVEQLGRLAPAAFIGLYFAATMLMLPAWPLSVAAGMIFGLIGGAIAVVAGATAGAAGAFMVTRYLARGYVVKKLQDYPRFSAVDRAVGEGGWKIVLLLRLSPAVPFTLQNFVYGATAIRFWPCMLATMAGILPGTVMYVYLGYAGRAGMEAMEGGAAGGLTRYVLLGVGLVATVVVTVYITRMAKSAITRYGSIAPQQTVSAPQAGEAAGQRSSDPWRGAYAAACGAVCMATLAACAHFQPNVIMRLFHPPAVVLTAACNPDDHVALDQGPYDAPLGCYPKSIASTSAKPAAKVVFRPYDWAPDTQENLP